MEALQGGDVNSFKYNWNFLWDYLILKDLLDKSGT